jgi:alpha-2-macroglobulin
VLNTFVGAGITDAPMRPLVRWMMAARKDGRWGNTQENAHAMEALVAYYRRYESTTPDFSAIVRLGQEELARERFAGRSAESRSKDVPLATVLSSGAAGAKRALTFTREGQGTLFYTARLRYTADSLFQEGLNAGFRIERRYEPYAEASAASLPASTSYKAGDLVRVTLTLRLTKERRFVAVTDPLPAGFEPVESWFQTTAGQLAGEQDRQSTREDGKDEDDESWTSLWRFGGFDHVERHDDRVELFATRLSEGVHVFSYIVRATTSGTFRTAPARAEEMYEPEVFGRTATSIVEVRK